MSENLNFTKNINDFGFDVVLPSHLVLNNNLSPATKLFYGLIRNLSRAEGYCYARNCYLAEMMGLTERRIQQMLVELENFGYIEKEIQEDEFNTQRKIFISSNFIERIQNKKSFRGEAPFRNKRQINPKNKNLVHRGKSQNKKSFRGEAPFQGGVKKISGGGEKNFTHKEDIQNEDKKEKNTKRKSGGDEPPCVPSSRSKKVKEEKIQVATNIFLTPTQEEALKKRLEGTGIEPRACYEKLSDWYIGKGKSGGKNDYLAITNWVIDAVKDGNSSKNASNAPKNVSSNMAWAKTLVDKLNSINALPSGISMFAGNEGINFQGNNAFLIINYREHGFKEQVINRLRKMGIVLKGEEE